MLTRQGKQNREQIQYASVEMLIPAEHLLRQIEKTVDFNFIYPLVEDMYSLDKGRPGGAPWFL